MMVIVMVLDTFNIKSLRDALECDLCSSLTYDENCNCIFCHEPGSAAGINYAAYSRLDIKVNIGSDCRIHGKFHG